MRLPGLSLVLNYKLPYSGMGWASSASSGERFKCSIRRNWTLNIKINIKRSVQLLCPSPHATDSLDLCVMCSVREGDWGLSGINTEILTRGGECQGHHQQGEERGSGLEADCHRGRHGRLAGVWLRLVGWWWGHWWGWWTLCDWCQSWLPPSLSLSCPHCDLPVCSTQLCQSLPPVSGHAGLHVRPGCEAEAECGVRGDAGGTVWCSAGLAGGDQGPFSATLCTFPLLTLAVTHPTPATNLPLPTPLTLTLTSWNVFTRKKCRIF